MLDRSTVRGTRGIAGCTALLRALVVALVAFLTSGVVHAYVEARVDDVETCDDAVEHSTTPDHEEGEAPACPDECIGPAHHCTCCSSLVVTCPPGARLAPADVRDADCAPSEGVRVAAGVRSRVDRPPRR
jgi:hypothetical protein